MLKKLSIIILVLSMVFISGCMLGGGKVTTEGPPAPGVKKPIPPDKYVPSSMTPEQYLTKYYNFYVARNFKEAYKMLPATKRESTSLKDYKQMNQSMSAQSFSVGKKKEEGINTVIEVKLKLKEYGNWTVVWHFVKKKKGFVVEDYSATGK